MRRRHAECNYPNYPHCPVFVGQCWAEKKYIYIYGKFRYHFAKRSTSRPFLELQTIANLCAFCMIFHLGFYFSFAPARVFPISPSSISYPMSIQGFKFVLCSATSNSHLNSLIYLLICGSRKKVREERLASRGWGLSRAFGPTNCMMGHVMGCGLGVAYRIMCVYSW